MSNSSKGEWNADDTDWTDGHGSDTDGNGEFRITGLLPGRFFISPRFGGESDLYASPVELEIKDGDVAGLEIKAHRGVTLSGSVTIDGSGGTEAGAKLTGLKVGVAFKEGDDYGTKEGTVNSDGSFKIRGVPPGQVRVHLPFDAKSSRYFSLLRVEYSRGSGDGAPKQIAIVEDPSAEARAKLMASWMRGQSPSADPPVLQPGAPAPERLRSPRCLWRLLARPRLVRPSHPGPPSQRP